MATERSEKRTERVPLNLTEQEFLDLARLAALDDRKVPEYIVQRVLRPHLYGTVTLKQAAINESDSGFGALGGPEA